MKKYLAPVLAISCVVPLPARAEFNYDDCILYGLQGTSSEAAIRLITQACESKRSTAERDRAAAEDERLTADYGQEATYPLIEKIVVERVRDGSEELVRISNQTGMSIGFLRFKVTRVERGYCAGPVENVPFRLALRPGAAANVPFGALTNGMPSACITVGYARWRPPQLADGAKALLGSRLEKLGRDPFQGRNDIEAPPVAPAPAPAAAPPVSSVLDATEYFRQSIEDTMPPNKRRKSK